ncbi:DUF3558 domain-containing protein [Mycobacteroides franklinii]|uniref:DUF3558 domain-containing protein n=1 Tax=Mycobacteroides franklinii TaxID=948102 RepID=UPI001F198F5E|nr:DUF3558 domain-containing protein [Mycobacteroides franklinii]
MAGDGRQRNARNLGAHHAGVRLMLNRITITTAAAAMIGFAATGSAGSTGGSAKTKASSTPPHTSETVTNTLLEPHPAPTDNNNGTSFDPCLAYTADELKSWGVKAGSVKDLGIGDTIQRGRRWSGEGWELQHLVVDRPLDDYLNHKLFAGSEAVVIEGLKSGQVARRSRHPAGVSR